MNQLELPLFFPLTEQIPLDLDYTQPDKPNYSVNSVTDGYVINTGTFSLSSVQFSNSIRIDLDNFNPLIKQRDMPWYRKMAYKVLGFKVN